MIYLSIGALLIIAAKSQSCTSDTNCAFDETCEYNPIFNVSYCTNETSILPFCSSNADCEPYPGTAINVTCQLYPTIINDTSGNMTTSINISIPLCLPTDQCQIDMDCLLGSTCEVGQLNETDFTFNYCSDFNTVCTNNTDCGDPGLACWNSTFCVVTCTDDSDCGVSGYVCDEFGMSGMLACQPKSLSMMTSTTTTMVPSTTEDGNATTTTDTPTATDVTTEGDMTTTGLDISGALQFAIFGVVIVAITHILCM